MSQAHELAVTGLYTGPNPLKAPEGALLEAENVMSVRPDILEYRPGFARDGTAPLDVSGNAPEGMFPFDGDMLVYNDNAAGSNKRFDWAATELNVTGIGSTTKVTLHDFAPPRAMLARKNLYVCSRAGQYKLTSASDTAAERCGLVRPALRSASHVTGSAVVVGNANSYAHRFCFRKEDANEVITRSPPSVSYPRTNSTGSTADPTYTIWTGTLVAGDVIEVYRTKTRVGNTAAVRRAVGAEFWLAQEYRVTAADVSAGYASIRDTTVDADLGAALYTNPTREGELKANDPPPASADVVWWKSCAWWLNTRPQQKIVRTLVDAGASRTDNGMTYVAKTGVTISSGNATITGFADTDEIHVGMAISTSADDPTVCAQFAATARVASKTSTTVTMSSAALGNAAVVTRYFYDVVRVAMGATAYGAGDVAVEVFAAGTSGSALGVWRFDSDSGTPRDVARELAYAINGCAAESFSIKAVASSFGEDAFSVAPGALALEEAGVGTTIGAATTIVDLEFACSSTTAFNDQPTWPAYYSRSSDTWEERNGLRYSKPDQPDHAPATNSIRIGSENLHGLKAVPLESALIVFREDGIYRVTGEAPDSWTITTLDQQTRLLSASAVDVIDNRAYAWTDRGVVVVSENGVSPLSEPVVGMGNAADELKARRLDFTRGNTNKGCFMVAWPTRGLVCLAVPASISDVYSELWWVYSISTGTWSRFLLSSRCAAFDAERNALYVESGEGDWFEIRRERLELGFEGACDDEHAVTLVETPSPTTIVIPDSDIDRWIPAAGDLIYQDLGQGEAVARVESAEYDGNLNEWTITTEGAHGFADEELATAVECIEATVAWRPITAGSPKRGMLWREGLFGFREVLAEGDGATPTPLDWRVFMGAKTDREFATYETTIDVDLDESELPTVFARGGVRSEVARCSHLYPRMRIVDRVRWHLVQLSLEIEGAQAGRVKR